MSTRIRPVGCCDTPNEPALLPAAERERMVAVFKALADPTRLDVFRLIAAQEAPLCACDVVDRFDVTQPTISHHLKVLREAGLVSVRVDKQRRQYRLRPEALADVDAWIAQFRPFWNERLDALERALYKETP